MAFDLSDFILPDKSEANTEFSAIVATMMQSVAFCIYDSKKVQEIFNHMAGQLFDKYGIIMEHEIAWTPPNINCRFTNARNRDL